MGRIAEKYSDIALVTDDNPRLRTAVDKALAANMTKDTINNI